MDIIFLNPQNRTIRGNIYEFIETEFGEEHFPKYAM